MLSNQEIFVWYFEQKGVDNPERFLGVGVNGDTNPLLNSMSQILSSAVVPQKTAQDENTNSPQENEQPENPTEENKNKTDEKQKTTTNLNIDSLIKLLEVIENLKQNKTKQSELYDFIDAIVSTDAE